MLKLEGVKNIDPSMMILFDDRLENRCGRENMIHVKRNDKYGRSDRDNLFFSDRFPEPKDTWGLDQFIKPAYHESYRRHMLGEGVEHEANAVPSCKAANWYQLYQCWEHARSDPTDDFWVKIREALEEIPKSTTMDEFHAFMLEGLDAYLIRPTLSSRRGVVSKPFAVFF
jgi:hypothetical protein